EACGEYYMIKKSPTHAKMDTSTKRKAMDNNQDKGHPSAPFKLHRPEVMSQTSAEINQAQPNTSTVVTKD
ncbi:unnamed protein product, partial [Allacma fusca]